MFECEGVKRVGELDKKIFKFYILVLKMPYFNSNDRKIWNIFICIKVVYLPFDEKYLYL